MNGGSLIAEARKRAGLTQADLADRLGTHQSVVARWETGRTNPTCETVVRAIRAAGFDVGVSLFSLDEHDPILIRRELGLLPHERLSSMVDAVRALREMSEAVRV